MKINLSEKGILLLTIFLLTGNVAEVYAQNPVTINNGKSSWHFMDTVQEKISKFEEKMKSVAQGKFAQTIGKGVSKAQAGVKYAQEKVVNAKKFVNQKKNEIQDSALYKAAQVSSEIAAEGKKIKEIEQKKKEEIASMEEEIEIQKEMLQAKLKEAENNYEGGMQIFQEEQTEKPEEEKEFLEQKIGIYKASSENEIEEIKKQIENLKEIAEKRKKDIEHKYNQEIVDEKDKIIELTNKAKVLAESKEAKEERTPQEEANEVAELFIAKGPVSLATAAENEKRRMKKVKKNALETINMAAQKSEQTETFKDDVQSLTATSETMGGTSESMHVATKNLASQLDQIYDMLESELKAIQAETTAQMASLNMSQSVDISAMVDICNYSKEGCGSGNGLGNITNMIQKGAAKIKSVKEKAAEVSAKIDTAKEKAQQVQDSLKQKETDLKETVDSVTDTNFSLKTML